MVEEVHTVFSNFSAGHTQKCGNKRTQGAYSYMNLIDNFESTFPTLFRLVLPRQPGILTD
jgi:hypothetical protein